MAFFLATSQGDPIESQESKQTITARIFANQGWEHYGPAAGNHVRNVHPRTEAEQQELEDAL